MINTKKLTSKEKKRNRKFDDIFHILEGKSWKLKDMKFSSELIQEFGEKEVKKNDSLFFSYGGFYSNYGGYKKGRNYRVIKSKIFNFNTITLEIIQLKNKKGKLIYFLRVYYSEILSGASRERMVDKFFPDGDLLDNNPRLNFTGLGYTPKENLYGRKGVTFYYYYEKPSHYIFKDSSIITYFVTLEYQFSDKKFYFKNNDYLEYIALSWKEFFFKNREELESQ